MADQLCPKCGSMHTFLGPQKWFCMECGEKWDSIAQDSKWADQADKFSEPTMTVQAAKDLIRNRQVGLPSVDEPHPVRHQVEDARIESKVMLHEIGSDNLGLRVASLDFLHELTDWRILDRNQQRAMNMDKLIGTLRKEAYNE